MVIDSHQHFWKYDSDKHAWIDDSMSSIRQDFLPLQLEKLYKAQGVDGCVAVQADQTDEETAFLLQLSKNHPIIKGVVGWVDLRSPDISELLEAYSSEEIIKGFRHIVQGEADPNFLLRPSFLNGISELKKHDFTYDILVFPHQLGAVLEFVKTFPDQKFVIDHIAKPYIKDGFYDGWAALMMEIGKQKNVYCKLSGIITEADYHHWTKSEIIPYLDLVLDAYGPNRLMFGSDWPVCLVAGNYQEVKELIVNFIVKLSSDEQRNIMGANALKFYNL